MRAASHQPDSYKQRGFLKTNENEDDVERFLEYEDDEDDAVA